MQFSSWVNVLHSCVHDLRTESYLNLNSFLAEICKYLNSVAGENLLHKTEFVNVKFVFYNLEVSHHCPVFIYGLFIDAVSYLDYVVSNDRMISE
jgi:hypothetical protein